MDPLSIAASVTGLLTAAGAVAKILKPYVSAAWETHSHNNIAAQVHSEIQSASIILSALQKLTTNIGSVPTRYASLIQVDQVIAVLTDGVLLFSELEGSLVSLPSFDPTSPWLPRRSRQQWARKESTFTALLTRLQGFKSSISLMLTILQRQVHHAALVPIRARVSSDFA
jgi:cell division control protein 24